MSQTGRPKKALETAGALKGTGATSAEAASCAGLMQAIANDPETTYEVKAEAALFYRHLASPPTTEDAGRREAMMGRATNFAVRVT